MARAIVNREIRYLLHVYRLLFNAGQICYVPRVKLLDQTGQDFFPDGKIGSESAGCTASTRKVRPCLSAV
jgi:hypothetical protein